jgi:hypothetical protein
MNDLYNSILRSGSDPNKKDEIDQNDLVDQILHHSPAY